MAMSRSKSLSTYLECSICLHTFSDPKQLACRHVYCKECLDGILEFKEDGSAVINCPVRCGMETFIACNQTTSDLGISYELKGILESYKEEEGLVDRTPLCTYTKGCQNGICLCCCSYLMCRSCNRDHEKCKADHQTKMAIIFDKDEENWKVLCDEHFTKCTHLCCDDTFLCIYCQHRTHKYHMKGDVNDQAAKVKQALVNDSKNNEKLLKLLKTTEESIASSEKKLNAMLQQRRTACLSSYLDLLRKDEEAIRTKLKNEHLNNTKQYPITISAEYYQEKLLKNDIQLTIGKDEILRNINMNNLINLSLECMTVSLSDTFDYQDKHPLGNLKCTVEDSLFCELDPTVSTFKDSFDQLSSNENILLNISSDLHTLLQKDDVHKLVVSKEDSKASNVLIGPNGDSGVVSSREELEAFCGEEEKLNEYLKQLDNHGMEYIKELLKTKKNEIFKLVLKARPNIVNMRGDFAYTPFLHAAEQNNVEIMKLLLENGESVDVRSANGSTALHVSACEGSDECALWLLENHLLLINVQNNSGDTP